MRQSRQAALVELEGNHPAAEAGYENALWLLQVLLDDQFYEEGKIKEEDKAGVEKCEYIFFSLSFSHSCSPLFVHDSPEAGNRDWTEIEIKTLANMYWRRC